MSNAPNLDLALIFPIKDEQSACLMSLKAECLYRAGVLSEAEKQAVHERASRPSKHRFVANVIRL
jgi:hypothetical protein